MPVPFYFPFTPVDMAADYSFSDAQRDHRGQFNRSLQELSDPTIATIGIPFYDQLRGDLTGTLGTFGGQNH